MSLPYREQILYDYITSNQGIREFWQRMIEEIRMTDANDDATAKQLSERLIMVYAGDQESIEPIEGLISRIDLLTLNWELLAYKLIGRDIVAEIRRAHEHKPDRFPVPNVHPFKPVTDNEERLHSSRVMERQQAYEKEVTSANRAQKTVWLGALLVSFGLCAWFLFPFDFHALTLNGVGMFLFAVVAVAVLLGALPSILCEMTLRPKKRPLPF